MQLRSECPHGQLTGTWCPACAEDRRRRARVHAVDAWIVGLVAFTVALTATCWWLGR